MTREQREKVDAVAAELKMFPASRPPITDEQAITLLLYRIYTLKQQLLLHEKV